MNLNRLTTNIQRLEAKSLAFCLCFAVSISVFASPVSARNPPEPQIGDIFEQVPGGIVREWEIRSWSNGRTGDYKYNNTIFEKEGVLIVALTNPVEDRLKNITVQKLTAKYTVAAPADVIVMDQGDGCNFLGVEPVVALFDPRSNIVTGYFPTSNGLEKWRWFRDDERYCQPFSG